TTAQLSAFTSLIDSGSATTQFQVYLRGAGGVVDFTSRVTGADSVNISDGGLTAGATVTGSSNADVFNDSQFNDVLNGGAGADTFNDSYSGDADTFNGGAGADTFQLNVGGAGAVDGGADTDTVKSYDLGGYSFSNVEVLDTYFVFATTAQLSAFTSLIDGGAATTQFQVYLRGAGGAIDFTSRVTGADSVNVSDGGLTTGMTVTGSSNADALRDSQFNDTLNGGAGADTFNDDHSGDTDTLNGGAGADTFQLNGGAGAVDGGTDTDTVKAYDLGGYSFSNVEVLDTYDVSATTAQLSAFSSLIDSGAATTQIQFHLRGAGGAIDFTSRVTGADSVVVADGGLTAGMTVTGSSNADVLNDSQFDDVLNGGAGSDTFNDNSANDTDTLNGGAGADTFLLYAGGAGTVDGGTETDTVKSSDLGGCSFSNVEVLETWSVYATTAQLSAFTSLIDSGSATTQFQVYLRGAGGVVDFTSRVTGADSVNISDGGLTAGATVTGSSNADVFNDSQFNDVLNGGAGADTFNDSYSGDADTFNGGAGADTFQLNVGGAGTIDGGTETDTVKSYDLGSYSFSNVEVLDTYSVYATTAQLSAFSSLIDSGHPTTQIQVYLRGAGGAIDFTSRVTGADSVNVDGYSLTAGVTVTGSSNADVFSGSSYADILRGGAGADTIYGLGGVDVLEGGAGNDVLDGGGEGDTVSYAGATAGVTVNLATTAAQNTGGAGTDTLKNFANLTGSGFNDQLTGDAFANILDGGAGDDILNGAGGADVMIGGLGNDTFITDGGDTITEAASAGADTVQSSVTLTLGANLENLTLTGTAAINGTGNALNNTIVGNDAANVLNGGGGTDTLIGGLGNDTYVTDGGDTITEAASAGTDTVQSSVSLTLGANLENLTLTGTAAINGTGNALNNTMTGNAAANVLNGGGGTDTLIGGLGDDTYVTDGGDTITEAANAGTDTVQSSVSLTLGANVENLTLTGTAAINGTGNALNNTIVGNDAANVLNGGSGTDTLIGGLGDDTYVTDGGDTITEAANAGTDTVQSSVSLTLGDNLENLTLTGTASDGTGNALDNTITGNDAANVLNGAGGADVLIGGLGDDTYVTDGGDTITEAANAGTDTVQSSVSLTLGDNLENLTL
ncbi:beta strand repeat-containing protein, partial [Rhodoblastus acidophilus]|uniref:beta strand repeat-containing protein n=1 Tax=Rhodoblastus acidophilus TaxID=1074 RepID=UPI0018B03838